MDTRASRRDRFSKKVCGLAIAAIVVATSFVTSANAAPIPAGQIRMDGLRNHFSVPGGGYAGEFVVNATRLNFTPVGLGANGMDGNHFVSFCVETTEYIELNKWYTAELNTETRNTNRALQTETAYLYSQFIKGTLDGYKYFTDGGASSTEKAASAQALQQLIWYYQDPAGFAARYGSNAFNSGGYFMGSALNKVMARYWHDHLAAWISSLPAQSSLDNVRIINIWEGTHARQDTLVMIPLPAPAWMAGLGLFGIVGGSVYRRRSGRSEVL